MPFRSTLILLCKLRLSSVKNVAALKHPKFNLLEKRSKNVSARAMPSDQPTEHRSRGAWGKREGDNSYRKLRSCYISIEYFGVG